MRKRRPIGGTTIFQDATNDEGLKVASGRTKFPDVLLFIDKISGIVFNGWELKFPDTPADDSEMLLNKLSDLEARIARMDSVSAKIEDLEKEIVKRNPTPVEKLEMRSLSSFPYSQKLTDYWADKEGAYDVMDKEKEKKEYTLTQKDVDTSYSEPDIKQSFSVKDGDYTEEDI